MDEQNKSVEERWGRVTEGERGYAADERDPRTDALRSDIEATRAEMSETVDAIQDRLRPRNVVSRAAESVRDATVGRVRDLTRGASRSFAGSPGSHDPYGAYEGRRGDGFLDRVRENPIPAAFAAGSVAWFAFAAARRGERRRMPAIYGSARRGEAFVEETSIDADVEPYEDSQDLESRRPAGTERVAGLARDGGARLRRATQSTRTGLQRLLEDNPLAVGAIAAAVGITIGLALPETERENEMMGEARQSMIDRARGAAHEAAGRVQEAAKAAQKVATEVVTGTQSES